jgi:hypothetical protein
VLFDRLQTRMQQAVDLKVWNVDLKVWNGWL